jgi:hypothetical protein
MLKIQRWRQAMSQQTRSQQMPSRQREGTAFAELTASVSPQTDPFTGYSVRSEPLVTPDAEQLESLAILDRLQARLTVMRHAVRNLVPRRPAE